jgi:hypothetical protein
VVWGSGCQSKRISYNGSYIIAFLRQLQGVVYLLASQWIEGGNTFCKYTNGTTINIGARVCPMQIRGQ